MYSPFPFPLVTLFFFVTCTHGLAPQFFGTVPHSVPSVGRRSYQEKELIPNDEGNMILRNDLERLSNIIGAVDQDNNGCISPQELLHIPIVRIALMVNRPTLIVPDNLNEKQPGSRDYQHHPLSKQYLRKLLEL